MTRYKPSIEIWGEIEEKDKLMSAIIIYFCFIAKKGKFHS
jgi:hypothetical protein